MTLRRALLALALPALLVLAARWLLVPERGTAAVVGPRHAAVEAPAQASGEGTEPTLRMDREQVVVPATASQVATEPDEVPEAWTEIDPRELPPDPVESGPARLELRLRDARSGDALAGRVQLWRVDAPGNDGWTAGDQLQLEAEVPAQGARFADLPEGRYRVVCERALSVQEPPEIEVVAPYSEREASILVPRSFEVRVRFVDRFGEPYGSASWSMGRSEWVGVAPAVTRARSPRAIEGYFVDEFASAWSDDSAHALGGPQPEEGFLLGRFQECSRAEPTTAVLLLRAPDGAQAEVALPPVAEGAAHYVTVGLAPEFAASRVRLPDGRASAAQVSATGLAQSSTDPLRDWREAPVRIEAALDGYRGVRSEWRPASVDLPWILLEPLD